ncbi:MAG: hypothetical protein ABI707_11890 [Ferruginibacter sp.]
MKSVLIAIIILLLGIIIFLAYKLHGIDSNTTGNPGTTCANKFCKDYSNNPWTGKINGYLAGILANNYKADKGKFYIGNESEITNVPDAKSAWFPLEVIKKYIFEIETRNCSKKCSDSIGIRVYYAKYPDSTNRVWTDFGMEMMTRYANHHTLFMVPTYWDSVSNIHKDFDPWGIDCHAAINKDSNYRQGLQPVFFIGGDVDAQNHGSLIPPDAEAGSSF